MKKPFVMKAMFDITFNGLPRAVAADKHVQVELENPALLSGLATELKKRFPTMDGTVFIKDANKLSRHYIFNVNGRFHFNDSAVTLSPGDRVVLMALPLGG